MVATPKRQLCSAFVFLSICLVHTPDTSQLSPMSTWSSWTRHHIVYKVCQDLHSFITCWWISRRLALFDFRCYFVCGSSFQTCSLTNTSAVIIPVLWRCSPSCLVIELDLRGPGHPRQAIPALFVFFTIWVSQSQAYCRAPSRGSIKLRVTARDVLVVWCCLISFVHTFSLKKHIYFWQIRLFYSCVQDPERPEGHVSQFGM